jgi:hypothetical protein
MPEDVVFSSSLGWTTIRSSRGFRLNAFAMPSLLELSGRLALARLEC